jgi:hypothetical protein
MRDALQMCRYGALFAAAHTQHRRVGGARRPIGTYVLVVFDAQIAGSVLRLTAGCRVAVRPRGRAKPGTGNRTDGRWIVVHLETAMSEGAAKIGRRIVRGARQDLAFMQQCSTRPPTARVRTGRHSKTA